MKTRTLFSLIATLTIGFSSAIAVSPPPDRGYPNQNTAEGEDALFSLTIGTDNTAVGFEALFTNITGYENTAVGSQTLFSNIGGGDNTASGFQALFSNTQGQGNTANGAFALFANTTGGGNTANGGYTLNANTTGDNNTASGFQALFSNTQGIGNTANGTFALEFNTTGNDNTADGASALQQNTTGRQNTAIGTDALFLNTTGGNNIALGYFAGIKLTTGNNDIDIGNLGVAGESNTIRIGTQGTQKRTFIAGISGATVAGGVGVIIDPKGQLGTVVSSARYKDAVKPMDKASEPILLLEPVTFRYKKDLDPVGIPQFGLVAEQVEKVDPDLVARGDDGKPYAVRYEAVNAMLLNEFLKAHQRMEQQAATISELQKQLAALALQIKTVSNQLQINQGAPRLIASEP